MSERPIRRALLSVFDKTGVADFGRALAARGVELVSTGGTAATLRAAGLQVTEVTAVTGAAEILDGRVKTLHPAVHAGLLARRDDPDHMAVLDRERFPAIDLLVANLYAFEAAVAAGKPAAEVIERIDIGGPAMIRAAAKNHEGVAVLSDPGDQPALLAELDANGGATTLAFRRHLAAKAFALTAAYDAAIARWFQRERGDVLPDRLVIAGTRQMRTRYGENPHQAGAFYVMAEPGPSLGTARQVQGKELSYNNIADADAALELVSEFDEPAVAIIKHANPCGVAIGPDLASAYAKALAADPVSAFGGIVATNRALDRLTAEALSQIFTEVVMAPEADPEALEVLSGRPNLRLLLVGDLPAQDGTGLTFRSIAGGFLAQERDAGEAHAERRTVTTRAPGPKELQDLEFAFKVVKHVKSNAIVFAKAGATVGIGAGQMSRLDSVRIAVAKAAEIGAAAGEPEPRTKGSVVASDAFFPFSDGLLAALEAGSTAAIQPGGSVRDQEVIDAANQSGAAMIFTGRRHFRH